MTVHIYRKRSLRFYSIYSNFTFIALVLLNLYRNLRHIWSFSILSIVFIVTILKYVLHAIGPPNSSYLRIIKWCYWYRLMILYQNIGDGVVNVFNSFPFEFTYEYSLPPLFSPQMNSVSQNDSVCLCMWWVAIGFFPFYIYMCVFFLCWYELNGYCVFEIYSGDYFWESGWQNTFLVQCGAAMDVSVGLMFL